MIEGNSLPYNPTQIHLGVSLNRTLTYQHHLQTLRKNSHIALIRRLAGTSWGARATTLCTATLALVHSNAEYCSSVWYCLRSLHIYLLDRPINDPLQLLQDA